jgi:hypothetical protein
MVAPLTDRSGCGVAKGSDLMMARRDRISCSNSTSSCVALAEILRMCRPAALATSKVSLFQPHDVLVSVRGWGSAQRSSSAS